MSENVIYIQEFYHALMYTGKKFKSMNFSGNERGYNSAETRRLLRKLKFRKTAWYHFIECGNFKDASVKQEIHRKRCLGPLDSRHCTCRVTQTKSRFGLHPRRSIILFL